MKAPRKIHLAYVATMVLTAAIYSLDLSSPMGTMEWLGYILPLLISALMLRKEYTLMLAMVCSFLIILAYWLDYVLEPPGALFNRIMGIGVLWTTTVLLLQRKRADESIQELNKALENRATELTTLNQDLLKLNRTLEKRVFDEVAQNREKDYLLIMKSRQAEMGEMINNIAHQWRQPLVALELFTLDLKACYESGEFNKEYLDAHINKSISAINQMSETITDFMNFFKPDKALTTFKPKDAIERVLALIEWKPCRPTINFSCDDDNINVIGYPNEYTQVLLNIFNNAQDALSERQIASPMLNVHLSKEQDRSVVTIADNAGGIDADIIDKVFEPYFTTKGNDKGTGIGLYMSKKIIEKNMNGKLTVRNNSEGAEFRIEL